MRDREPEVHQLAMRFGDLAAQEMEGIIGEWDAGLPRRSPRSVTVINLDDHVRCRTKMPISDQALTAQP